MRGSVVSRGPLVRQLPTELLPLVGGRLQSSQSLQSSQPNRDRSDLAGFSTVSGFFGRTYRIEFPISTAHNPYLCKWFLAARVKYGKATTSTVPLELCSEVFGGIPMRTFGIFLMLSASILVTQFGCGRHRMQCRRPCHRCCSVASQSTQSSSSAIHQRPPVRSERDLLQARREPGHRSVEMPPIPVPTEE